VLISVIRQLVWHALRSSHPSCLHGSNPGEILPVDIVRNDCWYKNHSRNLLVIRRPTPPYLHHLISITLSPRCMLSSLNTHGHGQLDETTCSTCPLFRRAALASTSAVTSLSAIDCDLKWTTISQLVLFLYDSNKGPAGYSNMTGCVLIHILAMLTPCNLVCGTAN
jgi:hypothetical protein